MSALFALAGGLAVDVFLAFAGLYTFLAVFFLLYVLVMGIYRAHLAKRLTFTHWVCGAWAGVLIGLAVDVVANVTVAWVVFLQPPKELLVTTRLTRYRTRGTMHQQAVAAWVCDALLDPFDPTGNHC